MKNAIPLLLMTLAFTACVTTPDPGASKVSGKPGAPQAQAKPLDPVAQAKKDLADKMNARTAELEKNEALAPLVTAAEEARRAYEKALQNDKDLAKARQTEKDAKEKLAALIASKLAAEAQAPKTRDAVAALEARKADIAFQARLLDLQLTRPGSPAREEADQDPAVIALRQAILTATAALSRPQEESALADARATESALWKKRCDTPEFQSLVAAEKACRDALQDAEKADRRPAKLQEARQAYENARSEALKKNDAAQTALKEIEAAETTLKGLSDQEKRTDSLLDILRAQVRRDGAGAVADARAKVEKAQMAYDKATDLPELRELQARRTNAWVTVDTLRKLEANAPELAEMTRKIEQVDLQIDALKAAYAESGKSEPELRRLLDQKEDLQRKRSAIQKEMKQSKPLESGVKYRDFLAAKADHVARLSTLPAALEAMKKLEAAKDDLEQAVEKQVASLKTAQSLSEERTTIAAKRRAAEFQRELAQARINSEGSPVRMALDTDPELRKQMEAWKAIEKDIKEKPAPDLVQAREKLAQAESARKAHEDTLRKDADYAKAVEARNTAEQALKKAQPSDAVDAARAAYEKAVNEKALQTPAGKDLQAKQETLKAAREECDRELKALSDQRQAVRQAIEKGDDPEVAAARQAVTAAETATKAAEKSEKLTALSKAADEARKTREKAVQAIQRTDEPYQALRRQLDELNKPPVQNKPAEPVSQPAK
jgi:hypothetical protein